MCAKVEEQTNTEYQLDEVKVQETRVSAANTTCVLCEFVINVLTKFINENSTEPEVEKWLEYVCNSVMPSSIKSECSAFVAEFGPVIIPLIVQEIQPSKVCSFIKICPKQSELSNMVSQVGKNRFTDEEHLFRHRTRELAQKQNGQTLKTEIPCAVCQFTIQYLFHQFNVDKTEKSIEVGIQNVCNFTPKTYKQHCEALVSKYGVKLIDFMTKYSEPLNVCHSISMCPAEEVEAEAKKQEKPIEIELVDLKPAVKVEHRKVFFDNDEKVEAKNGSIECSLCIYAANIIETKLKDNKTEQEIVKELELVCNLFPASLRDQCTAFMNEYGPYVVQLIAADLDPDSACAALRLCDKAISEDALRKLYSHSKTH